MFCIVIVVIFCDSASIVCQMINWFLSIKITLLGYRFGLGVQVLDEPNDPDVDQIGPVPFLKIFGDSTVLTF